MNTQIRRIAFAVLIMFGAITMRLGWVQVVKAKELAGDNRNTRLLLKEYAIERGPIVSADGQTLAESVPTPNSELTYLRSYPLGERYAHAVGYYSVRYGRRGLEDRYNEALTGEGGVITMQDLGDRLLAGDDLGDTLVLSIHTALQNVAAEALAGKNGAVVALDPVSGQILAMISTPSFDSNALSQHASAGQEQAWTALNGDPAKPLVNRATSEIYPPGSTFKLLTAVAAMTSGMGDANYPVSKEYLPPQTDKPIGNFGGGTCGGGMAEALKVSCNTYFAQLGAELPAGALEKTAESFGFGEKPPLDSSSTASRMPSSEQLRSPAFRAQSAIGQFDVAATPLQMALVVAGIGNEGKVPEPRLVREIRDSRAGIVESIEPKVWKEAVSPEVANAIKQMMIDVVDSGTGRAAAIPGVQIAGKTGTAQVGATGEDTLAWFVAVAPAEAPKIAIAVVVEGAGDPSNETGGRLAAPIAKQVLEAHRGIAGW